MLSVRRTVRLIIVTAGLIGAALHAQGIKITDVDRWTAFGSDHRLEAAAGVPGGAALRIMPPAAPAEVWKSGAVLRIDEALTAGERIEAIFWARADRAISVPVSLQANSAPYASFSRSEITLSASWQSFTIVGAAPVALSAGSQVLSVQLGKSGSSVSLGPALIVVGKRRAASSARAFDGYRPASIAQDVRIRSPDGTMLAATLRLPNTGTFGPFPAVLMLNGAGPNMRGGWDVLGARLLARGVATLEYDKRGTGQSTGKFDDILTPLVQDAQAAIAYLRAHRQIDPERVAIAGLSQGGVIAPAVAAKDPRMAATVMLAGAVDKDHSLLLANVRTQLAAQGLSREGSQAAAAAVAGLLDARQSGAGADVIAAKRTALADAIALGGWSRDLAAQVVEQIDTPVALSAWTAPLYDNLVRVRSPVLALYAGFDKLVPAETLPLAQQALAQNKDATVALIPGVNHLFQLGARTGGAEEFLALGPPVAAPDVVTMIEEWLVQRLHADNTRRQKARKAR